MLSKKDANIAGGKGASLGEMAQSGIPVPDGFVVLSSTFDHFLKETDLAQEIDSIIHSVDHKAIHTVENASEKIRGLIEEREVPEDIAKEIINGFKELKAEFVAVRSSATAEDGAEHAWAGQLDSFLNTTEANLMENVRKCWSSLFTPRAIFYRFEKGLHGTDISVAVVIQKMIQSEVSGIAFSVHPVTEDRNQLIIEAGYGLGEAIVSGSITPDSYVVEKEPRHILDINVAEQKKAIVRSVSGNDWVMIDKEKRELQKLSDNQILELSTIILNIEKHYAFPCDIEWAHEAGKFYIVQSRPITTLRPEVTISKEKTSSLVEEIKKLIWFKSWEAKFPMFLVTIGAPGYFQPLKEAFGFDLGHFLVITHEGILGGYWVEEELTAFGSHLTKFAENDPSTLIKWSDCLKEETDKCRALMRKGKEYFLTAEHFRELRRADEILSAYQITVREVINYLPDNLREQYTPNLEGARKHSETIFFELGDMVTAVLGHVAQQEKVPTDLIGCITGDELEAYFDGKSLPVQSILRGRYTSSGFINHPEFSWLSSEDIKQIEKSFVENSSDEIKGQSAYKGKVTGRARVIKNFSAANELTRGEILVTGMTDPNYVPIMEKAGAIVTDAGGMLCHAAIVSREMKKPCIVGTKIATHLIKDGDMIEVDADNGIVRILNSTNEELNPNDYIRMFAGKSFPYLFSNVFLGYYKDLGVVSIQGEGSWLSFFPKSLVGKTNKEGGELYTSKTKYHKYKKDFDHYIKTSQDYFESILNKQEVSAEEVEKYFDHISNLFVYYSKTEFFYTDGVDQEKMAITVKEFDDLKLGGRSYLNKIFFESDGFIKTLIRKISGQTSVPESDLLNYSVLELVQLIKDDMKIDHVEIENRHTFFESKDQILFDSEAKPLIDEFFSNYMQISDVIKGTIANKGKARGKARVLVPDAKDFEKISTAVREMKDGEILIAETTSPDIITACKKAAAIVTNQGGQLSHAAIVSRELGIPCIIGTDKDVILNIKTGDEVEVDANTGIIRILK